MEIKKITPANHKGNITTRAEVVDVHKTHLFFAKGNLATFATPCLALREE